MSKIKFILIFLVSTFTYCQNFDFDLHPTHETCAGNGQIFINITNSLPSSSINFVVYRLPDIVTPLVITSNLNIDSLVSGEYKVIGYHNLNGNDEIVEKTIEIQNNIEILNYSISSESLYCVNNGSFIVNVFSGTAATYQLISGPVVTNSQTSNVFSNLPVGEYEVKVTDVCGNVVVKTYSLNFQNLSLDVLYSGLIYNSSNNTSNLILNLNCPLTVQNYTIPTVLFPINITTTVTSTANSSPLTYNTTINNISELLLNGNNFKFTQEVDFNTQSTATFHFLIVDNCGTNYEITENYTPNNDLISDVNIELFGPSGTCKKQRVVVNVSNFVSSYMLEFIEFPSGFVPTDFNVNYPGAYNAFTVVFENSNLTVPEGHYELKITDSIGTIKIIEFDVQYPQVELISNTSFPCGSRLCFFSIVTITEVLLVEANPNNGIILPLNLSDLIQNTGNINIDDLPVGHYKFKFTDICGNIKFIELDILPFIYPNAVVSNYPSCDLQFGTVMINALYEFDTVEVLEAPTAFNEALPYTINEFFNQNPMLINKPIGVYKIKTTTSCGTSKIDLIEIVSYFSNFISDLDINCGSFDYYFSHQTNVYFEFDEYYLQKFDEITQQWVHPYTNQAQINFINTNCAMLVSNNTDNVNIFQYGKFRLVHVFSFFQNSTTNNGYCEKVLEEFEVNESLNLNMSYFAICNQTNTFELYLNATGAEPLNYKITHKNGVNFEIDNGQDSLFQNLEPANYTCQIEDVCGNVIVQNFNQNNSINLNILTTPVCENSNVTLSVPNLPFLTYEWFSEFDPSTILSNNSSVEIVNFQNINQGNYYVRITNSEVVNSCLNSVQNKLINIELPPNAGEDQNINLCTINDQINLFDYLPNMISTAGNWYLSLNNQEIINGIWNTNSLAIGTYNFYYLLENSCQIIDVANYSFNFYGIPENPLERNEYYVCKGQNFLINFTTNPNYSYTWIYPDGNFVVSSELNIQNIAIENSGVYKLKISNQYCNDYEFIFSIFVNEAIEFDVEEICVENVKKIKINFINPLNLNFDLFINSQLYSNVTNEFIVDNNQNYTIVTNYFGCEFSKNILISNNSCNISNGVSANDDGLNDYFDLSGMEVLELKIFNRYGTEVYSKLNYLKEWRGQDYKDRLLPSATYFYVAKLKSNKSITGWVYLTY